MTHFLKLLDKMCEYEMDPAYVVERTRFCPQTDGRTDRRTDRRTDEVKPVYPPFNFVKAGGKMMFFLLVNAAIQTSRYTNDGNIIHPHAFAISGDGIS